MPSTASAKGDFNIMDDQPQKPADDTRVVTPEMLENLKALQRRSAERGLRVRISDNGKWLVWSSLKPDSTRECLTTTFLIKELQGLK